MHSPEDESQKSGAQSGFDGEGSHSPVIADAVCSSIASSGVSIPPRKNRVTIVRPYTDRVSGEVSFFRIVTDAPPVFADQGAQKIRKVRHHSEGSLDLRSSVTASLSVSND
jgi:hypothetical protein